MSRRLALIPFLFLLPVAACGAGGKDATTPPPAAPTTAAATTAPAAEVTATPAAATSTKPSATPAANTAKAAGSGDPGFGTQFAFLTSSKLAGRQVTYDLVEWFDGKQAVKACAEDGEKAAENDYCTGYYIRNRNQKLRTLTVDPDAPIKMLVDGAMKKVDLKTFLAGVPEGSVIKFDIDANRIMSLEQIYLP
jgi:hypothetical protein